MSECQVDAVVGSVTNVSAQVATVTTVSATTDATTMSAVTASTTTVSGATATTTSVSGVTATTTSVNGAIETLLLLELIDKINRLREADEPAIVKLWDTTFLDTTLMDSNPYVGTTSYQEIGRAPLLRHSFRDSGYLLLQVVAEFTNTVGPFTVDFQLETAPDFVYDLGSNPATRGLEGTWGGHETWTTQSFDTVVGTGICIFRAVVHAGGHTGTTWDHYHEWESKATGSTALGVRKGDVGVITTPIDPTVDLLMRLRFRASALGAGRTFNVVASRATLFHPRDQSGY